MTVKPGSKEIVARSVGCTNSVYIVSQCKLVPFLLLYREHGTGYRRSWNCCDRWTRFVVIWKHFCFILSTGTRIRIDSVIRRQSSSRGRNTSASVTVTVTVCGWWLQKRRNVTLRAHLAREKTSLFYTYVFSVVSWWRAMTWSKQRTHSSVERHSTTKFRSSRLTFSTSAWKKRVGSTQNRSLWWVRQRASFFTEDLYLHVVSSVFVVIIIVILDSTIKVIPYYSKLASTVGCGSKSKA